MLKIKILAAVSAVALLFTGCSSTNSNAMSSYDFSKMNLIQLEEPKDGQDIAVIDTTLGTFKIALYKEYCPNTVANFIDRANDGFYNGKSVFAVCKDDDGNGVYFLTGAENKDGTGGVTSDGEFIENEYSVDLWPFKGAVLSYNENSGYGDSRFFVIDEFAFTEDDADELRSYKDENGNQKIPDELLNQFMEKGCVAGLAGLYCVFAQTYEGLDVVEKICAAEVEKDTSTPADDIIINSVTIGKYKSEANIGDSK